jgi:mono/diheme cytochrome c family protein
VALLARVGSPIFGGIDSPGMRRLALLAVLVVAATGCGTADVITPTPNEVVGKAPTPPAAVKGDPAAGKAVFASNGCGGCHTFTPAAATGKVGPDLDNLAEYAQKAGQPIEEFTSSAITNPPPPYVPPGYPNNVMPTTFGTSLSAQQLADLVAFLTQSK